MTGPAAVPATASSMLTSGLNPGLLVDRLSKGPPVMAKRNPKQFWLVLGLILASAASLLLWRLGLSPLYAYLAGMNILTFLLYGYDKRQARVRGGRVPEAVLHIAALLGGTPGALAGQFAFRHKTQKRSFRIVFGFIVLVQIAGVYAYWRFTRG